MNNFDEKAKEWDKNKMHLERTMAVAGQLVKMVPLWPGMKAMEFGAGTGLLSYYLKHQLAEITMMDTSREMLNIAQQKMEAGEDSKFKFLVMDLESQDYSGDPFDIIYSQMVLHHIRDIKAIVGKFYHLLNPGGVLAIADLYTEDGSFHDGDPDVHHGFDPEALSAMFLQQGLKDCSFEKCFVMRKEISPGSTKDYPVFLITAYR